MTEEKYAIRIEGLTKNYGRHRGVEGISLSVETGDVFGFLGPNGAGKSTTIRSMLGMLRFREGEIYLLGMDVKKQKKEILRRVGYLPSEVMFYPSMKVREIIEFAQKSRGLDCRKEAERLCRLLEVDREKRIGELSLGNRKKVGIVCALQHNPQLLILDEPTSGLDPLMQEVFFELLAECSRRGATCFFSSHVLSEVKRYCKNAAIIKEGRLIRQDSMENLAKSGLRRVSFWKDGQRKEFSYSGEAKELLERLRALDPEDVLIEDPDLEKIFLHYYEEEKG